MSPIRTLFIAIFVMSIGFGLMTPSVSLYSVIGFGVNEWELGILGALISLPYVVGPTIFGRYSDRVGRKPLVLGGLSIYACAALAYMVAPHFAFLAILRIIEGVCFSLIWPASEAWVGDLSSPLERPRHISHYSVAWSAGYMLGPFIMGVVVTHSSIIYSFVLAAALVAVSIPIIMAVRGSAKGVGGPEVAVEGVGGAITVAVLFAMVVWGVAQLAYFFLLPAYTLALGLPAAYAGYLIGTVAFFRTVVFIVYSRLLKALKASILPLGMSLIAFSMLVTWLSGDPAFLTIAASTLGLAFGMIYAFSLGHVLGRPAKGLYAGLFESAIGIGQIAGPLSMGYIGFLMYPSAPYLVMGLLGGASTAAIALIMFMGKKKGT